MNKIRLPHDGAEYAHFTFSPAVPDDVVIEAQIGSGSWVGVERPPGAEPRLLLRGPDSGSVAGVLVSADSLLRVRVKDGTEVVVRGAGQIVITR